eukprot:m.342601 g.342601  ORF g.342601 m.342601 type:complete len:1151 (+) comp21614_c0_seq1:262-3714(+)
MADSMDPEMEKETPKEVKSVADDKADGEGENISAEVTDASGEEKKVDQESAVQETAAPEASEADEQGVSGELEEEKVTPEEPVVAEQESKEEEEGQGQENASQESSEATNTDDCPPKTESAAEVDPKPDDTSPNNADETEPDANKDIATTTTNADTSRDVTMGNTDADNTQTDEKTKPDGAETDTPIEEISSDTKKDNTKDESGADASVDEPAATKASEDNHVSDSVGATTVGSSNEDDKQGIEEQAEAANEVDKQDIEEQAEEAFHDRPTTQRRHPRRNRENPLDLNWTFAFNSRDTNSVIYLADKENTHEDILLLSSSTAVLYDSLNNDQNFLRGHKNVITSVCASENKRWVATADVGSDAAVVVWDTQTGTAVQAFFNDTVANGAISLAFSRDGRILSCLVNDPDQSRQRIVGLEWSVQDAIPLFDVNINEFGVFSHVDFSRDSSRQLYITGPTQVLFATLENSGEMTLKLPEFRGVKQPKGAGSYVLTLSVPDSDHVLTATSGGYVVEFSFDKNGVPTCHKFIKLSESGISTVAFTPMGKNLVVGGTDGVIRYFDKTFRMVGLNDKVGQSPIMSISFAEEDDNDDLMNTTARLMLGLVKEPLMVPKYVCCSRAGYVYRVHTDVSGEVIQNILRSVDSGIRAIAAHPKEGQLACAGYSGFIQLWNYQARKVMSSTQFPDGYMPHCMAYSPDGTVLAVGFTNGTLMLLDSFSLRLITETTKFREGDTCILKVIFSDDGHHLATMDDDKCVALYRTQDNFDTPYFFVGKNGAHYRPIVDILFCKDANRGTVLLSIGEDRMLTEFDIKESSFDNGLVTLGTPVRVEQRAIPTSFATYPTFGKKEECLIVANNEFKLKLLNKNTKKCRKTVLGPVFDSPVDNLVVLPPYPKESSPQALAYVTNDKIGLTLLPADGNPYSNTVVVGHAEGVANIVSSFDGRYIFSCGGQSLQMWAINTDILEERCKLGGDDLEPFVGLIEGGRDGKLFKEMEDYFYLAQLQGQGLSVMQRRKVSEKLPISQIPSVLRGLGFFPSERDIEDMKNEVKLSEYMETGNIIEEIDFPTFIKLYVNHRPLFDVTVNDIQKALGVIAGDDQLPLGELFSIMQEHGEKLNEKELAKIIGNLLEDGGDSLDGNADSSQFIEQILGISTDA